VLLFVFPFFGEERAAKLKKKKDEVDKGRESMYFFSLLKTSPLHLS